jgi:hypothetical protein
MQTNLSHDATEDEFEAWLKNAAPLFGWTLRYHTHDSRRSPSGFPDWVLIHPKGAILVLELKGVDGLPTEEQVAWVNGFRVAGIFAGIVWPHNASDVLRRLRYPAHPIDPLPPLTRAQWLEEKKAR